MSVALLRSAGTVVIPDGQSLNILPGGVNAFGQQAIAGFVNTGVCAGVVVSIGSTGWAQLDLTKTTRCFVHANCAPRTILLMNGGTQDFTDGDDGPTYYARVKNYAVAAKAAGFTKVVICTTTIAAGFSSGQNTKRRAGNDLVIGNADAAFDAVVDLASDSSLSNPGAPPSGTTYYGTGNLANVGPNTWYQDGVHWSAVGAADAGGSTHPALAAVGAS